MSVSIKVNASISICIMQVIIHVRVFCMALKKDVECIRVKGKPNNINAKGEVKDEVDRSWVCDECL